MSHDPPNYRYVESTWGYRIRYVIASAINRFHRGVCWVDLYIWVRGDQPWSEIRWRCDDAQKSANFYECGHRCWCGKNWAEPELKQLEEPANVTRGKPPT